MKLTLWNTVSGGHQFDPTAIEELRLPVCGKVSDSWKIVYSSGFRAHPEIGTLAILKPPVAVDSLQIQVERTQRRYYFDPIEAEAEPIESEEFNPAFLQI